MSILTAIVIPVIEIVLSTSLILNFYRSQSIKIYRLLLLGFVLFHIWNNFIAVQKPCNCFGSLIEFDGIWMIIIVLALFLISITPIKYDAEKVHKDSVNKRYLKNEIILTAGIIILFIIVAYVRWLRIEEELNLGLLSSNNLSLINETVNLLSDELVLDKQKYKIVLFLKSPTCGDCIQQLLFWNSPKYIDKFLIIGTFSDKIDLNLEVIENYFNLGFKLHKIPYKLWEQIIGISLPYSAVLLLDKDNTFINYTIFLKMEELVDYTKKIENIK